MTMSNRHNRAIYRLWAPVYDTLLERFFRPGRERAVHLLDLEPGEHVFLAGVGTGQDLPMLPAGCCAAGLDLSPDMLRQARAHLPLPAVAVTLTLGDAQQLPYHAAQFDAALLSLVLSVVPDARRCLQETIRVLRPGGRLVVFDKFLPAGARVSPLRRGLNTITTRFGTDINRSFDEMIDGINAVVTLDEPSILGGAYRVIVIRVNTDPQ